MNATPNPAPLGEPEARALADAINQVARNQPPDAALKLVEMALARAPQQPIVLNAAARYLFRTGNAARARELWQRALATDANSKVLWANLAAACRALGDLDTESAALDKALALDPRYVLALLHKGDFLERVGKPKAASIVYEGALAGAARSDSLLPTMSSALAHAREVVLRNQREMEAFLEQEVAPVLSQHSALEQQRFIGCRDIVLGKRRAYASEPKNMLFPYLPAIEFFAREDFPWLDILEEATEDIAAEALSVLDNDRSGFAPYVDFPPGTPVDQWGPLNHSMDWSTYSLWHDGVPLEDHIAKCPKTAAVLARLPLCDVPGYAPGAYFSVLKPHTRLPAHTGTTNTRSIVHLPLIIPERCEFRVGSQVRPWRRGKAWVFDDTIEHEAWNDSDQTRVILIFDIWNPLLTAAERDMVRALTIGVGRYYGADAPQLGSR
ncbi:MAG: aspartyl/asparaginyl beta-hydroxylase domain-containing protein [Steroidobacteraceae bacterium]